MATPAPAPPRPAPRADVVVGVPATTGDGSGEAARSLQSRVAALFPDRAVSVLLLVRRHGVVEAVPPPPGPPLPDAAQDPSEALPSPAGGGLSGPESGLGALLRAAPDLDGGALALVAPDAHADVEGSLWPLLAAILGEGYDLACPLRQRSKHEGAMNTGVVYPLVRALFGRRLRQPLGGEVALSGAAARRLAADPDWESDPLYAGSGSWLVAKALTGDLRVCQPVLPRRSRRPGEPAEEPSRTLARVLGLLFREMERHASSWQRVRGSTPVPTLGSSPLLEGEPLRADLERMIEAFRLGRRELGLLWSEVLPPATLLALKRASEQPSASFGLADAVWARVVYDFAVGHYARVMDRGQLLRSMAPIYMAWVAGFLREVRMLDAAAAEERVESLCREFERSKPYLISRWRWPDRFGP